MHMQSEQQQRIMGYFIEEAKDHLDTIERGLLNLQSTIEDSEMVNEVFRAAHSVKGGAAMLGLTSIQRTAHRLEDYFKVLRECQSIRVDQKIETLFFRIFDTLQALLDQLQGPFGLTDDKSSEIMSDVEPVFGLINEHLAVLVAKAGATPPDEVDLTQGDAKAPGHDSLAQPSSPAQASKTRDAGAGRLFQSEVPNQLREMLNLFRQSETAATRQQLHGICDSLIQMGNQFDLSTWCDLIQKAQRAIANEENTYKALAPVIIKEIKQAKDLVVSGKGSSITCSDALEGLLPAEALLDEESPIDLEQDFNELFGDEDEETIDLDLSPLEPEDEDDGSFFEELAMTSSEGGTDDQWLIGDEGVSQASMERSPVSSDHDLLDDFMDDTGESESVTDDDFDNLLSGMDDSSTDSSDSDPGMDDGLDLIDGFDDALLDNTSPTPADSVGPEVGAAELNSLADLFEEGGSSNLDLSWQDDEASADNEFDDLDDDLDFGESNDFSDLFSHDPVPDSDSNADPVSANALEDSSDLLLDNSPFADMDDLSAELDSSHDSPQPGDSSGLDDLLGIDSDTSDNATNNALFPDLDLDSTDDLLTGSGSSESEEDEVTASSDFQNLNALFDEFSGDESVVADLAASDSLSDLDLDDFGSDTDSATDHPPESPSDPDVITLGTGSETSNDGDDLDLDNLWGDSDPSEAQADSSDEIIALGAGDEAPSGGEDLDLDNLWGDSDPSELQADPSEESIALGSGDEAPSGGDDLDLDNLWGDSDPSELQADPSEESIALGSGDEAPSGGDDLDLDNLWGDSDPSELQVDASDDLDIFGTSEGDEDSPFSLGDLSASSSVESDSSDDLFNNDELDLGGLFDGDSGEVEPATDGLDAELGSLDEDLESPDEPLDQPSDDSDFADIFGDELPEPATNATATAGSDFDALVQDTYVQPELMEPDPELEADGADPDNLFEGLDLDAVAADLDENAENLDAQVANLTEGEVVPEGDVDLSEFDSWSFDDESAIANAEQAEADLAFDEAFSFDEPADSSQAEPVSDPSLNEEADELDILLSDAQGNGGTDSYGIDFDLDALDFSQPDAEADSVTSDEALADLDTLLEDMPDLATSGDESDAPGAEDFGTDGLDDLGEMSFDDSGSDATLDDPFEFDLDTPSESVGDEDDFADLENLLDEPSSEEITESDSSNDDDDFSELDALLGDDLTDSFDDGEPDADDSSEVESVDDDFADLDALLADDSAEPDPPASSANATAPASGGIDEFDELEKLLEDAEQTMGGAPSSKGRRSQASPVSRRLTRARPRTSDQNMRVSVKNLDNLNNLIGELVVNRNSLEQTQERLRQFLDNLLYQVQQLSDVGQRMRDLYERSLLESSLLSSRKTYQGSPTGNGSTQIQTGSTGHATGANFDALEMDRFTGFHTLSQEMIELIVRVRESASDIDFVVDESDQITRTFRQITTQLQEGLTRARMVPFAQTADRLPRAVRDISIKCGKQAELVVEGRDTLIDKMILEQLYDPMTHLVNNAITHGIESPEDRTAGGKQPTGRITIRSFHQGNQTVISISDDGAGIDTERVKAKAIQKGVITPDEAKEMSRLDIYDLLFHSGFSTRDRADDFAGRGVGMDVVRTNLNEIRGAISTDSTLGKGTTFTIRLPLTLSISKALCCISNRARIAFPMDGVEDMLDVPKDRIQTDEDNRPCILWREMLLPFQPLQELLSYNRTLGRGSVYGGNQEDDMISVVVLRSAGNFLALQVDQVLGEQEIVIKQLEGPVPKPVGIAGATVLGDGRIMPIADVLELIDLSMGRIRRDGGSSIWSKEDIPAPDTPSLKSEPTVLIVDDSITVRELLSMTFNKVGYRVEQARDGQEAWEKLRSGLPCDLVFCDIEMPRMDGLELLSRIQKDASLSTLPIAMLTSRGADRHRQMAITLGAKGYFTKPYLEEVLLDAAQRMLKGEVMVSAGG